MVKTCKFIFTHYDDFLQKTTVSCSACGETYDDEYHLKIRQANYCQNCGCKVILNESTKFQLKGGDFNG